MGLFLFLSSSKKQAQKLQDQKKGKDKAAEEEKPKYMHTPKHAYVDALNSTCGTSPADNRQSLREAAERRKSRMSRNSSYVTMNGLHNVHSSSTQNPPMSSWEARKLQAQREQFLQAAAPVTIASPRREYQCSPLASIEPSTAPASTAPPSTVSSFDDSGPSWTSSSRGHSDEAEDLVMASLSPAPLALRPSLHKSYSSQKKSVTIQAPANSSLEPSPTSPTFDDQTDVPPVMAIVPSFVPVTIIQSAYEPLGKAVTVKSAEVLADTSSEEEGRGKVMKRKKRLSLF